MSRTSKRKQKQEASVLDQAYKTNKHKRNGGPKHKRKNNNHKMNPTNFRRTVVNEYASLSLPKIARTISCVHPTKSKAAHHHQRITNSRNGSLVVSFQNKAAMTQSPVSGSPTNVFTRTSPQGNVSKGSVSPSSVIDITDSLLESNRTSSDVVVIEDSFSESDHESVHSNKVNERVGMVAETETSEDDKTTPADTSEVIILDDSQREEDTIPSAQNNTPSIFFIDNKGNDALKKTLEEETKDDSIIIISDTLDSPAPQPTRRKRKHERITAPMTKTGVTCTANPDIFTVPQAPQAVPNYHANISPAFLPVNPLQRVVVNNFVQQTSTAAAASTSGSYNRVWVNQCVQQSASAAAAGSQNGPVQQSANFYNGGEVCKRGLRPIIIDGSNVAMGHSNGKFFSVEGLNICIEYFLKRGHKVKAFIPRFRLKSGQSSNHQLLYQLQKTGHVICTPSREVNGKRITSYDDRFIVQSAAVLEGIIVSGDNFKDLIKEDPSLKPTIESRLLMPTWIEDMIIFPQDPLGRAGPSLEEFLKFP